ncbi:hypothetical protein VPH35_055228 [Triticum aestivum]
MALKAVSQEAARHKKSGGSGGGDRHRRIWFERDVLLALRHPLLPALRCVLATDAVVGFAIGRCSSGDLNSLRRRQTEKMFSDSVIRDAAKILVASRSTAPDSKLKVVYKKYSSEKLGGVAHPDYIMLDYLTRTRRNMPRRRRSKPRRKKQVGEEGPGLLLLECLRKHDLLPCTMQSHFMSTTLHQ